MAKINVFFEKTFHLVRLYCKTPETVPVGREMKNYKLLRKLYSHEILENIDLPFKINTLGFFLSEKGEEYIKCQKRK